MTSYENDSKAAAIRQLSDPLSDADLRTVLDAARAAIEKDGWPGDAGREAMNRLEAAISRRQYGPSAASIWTWENTAWRVDPATGKYKLPMWHKYRIELFPHYPGVPSGIVDSFGNELEFPAAFRRTRPDMLTGKVRQRGIIKIGGL